MKSTSESEGVRTTATRYLSRALNNYRENVATGGFTEEKFVSCVVEVTKKHSGRGYSSKNLRFTCPCVFKSLWLSLLGILAFALLVAGFKPLSFLFHKVRMDIQYSYYLVLCSVE